MAAQQRRNLEQLMGSDSSSAIDLSDSGLCKAFCVKFCIHDIFAGTRSPLGACPYTHIERARLLYQAHEKIPSFESVFDAQLERVERMAQQRREEATQKLFPAVTDDLASEIRTAVKAARANEHEIKLLNAELAALGRKGLMDRAAAQMKKLDAAKAQQAGLDASVEHLRAKLEFSPHLKLQVCHTCGSLLSSLDSDVRLADHFAGKLHRGYALVEDEWLRRHPRASPSRSN